VGALLQGDSYADGQISVSPPPFCDLVILSTPLPCGARSSVLVPLRGLLSGLTKSFLAPYGSPSPGDVKGSHCRHWRWAPMIGRYFIPPFFRAIDTLPVPGRGHVALLFAPTPTSCASLPSPGRAARVFTLCLCAAIIAFPYRSYLFLVPARWDRPLPRLSFSHLT